MACKRASPYSLSSSLELEQKDFPSLQFNYISVFQYNTHVRTYIGSEYVLHAAIWPALECGSTHILTTFRRSHVPSQSFTLTNYIYIMLTCLESSNQLTKLTICMRGYSLLDSFYLPKREKEDGTCIADCSILSSHSVSALCDSHP